MKTALLMKDKGIEASLMAKYMNKNQMELTSNRTINLN